MLTSALTGYLYKGEKLPNNLFSNFKDASIHQLFEAQVEQTPDAVAVVFQGHQLSYQELNCRANQLAHHLRSLGVGPEVLVGICVERSLEMIVGFLGILKAGGAYVPLDPAYPKERLAFMLEDTQTPVLLTNKRVLESLPEHSAQIVCLDTDWENIAKQSAENLVNQVMLDNLAYVIYTSGSTGKPKGVAVPHQAVIRLVINTNYINLESSDVVAQASNCSFDAATFEIWGALLNGARLVGITKDITLSPKDFAAVIREEGISVLFLTTALFNQLTREVPSAFQSVRHLLFGGEAVDPRRVKEVLKNGSPQRLLHVYGPTESTTFTTWYLVQDVPEEATIPIGFPISNTECFLLDPNLQPTPVGVPGELYIGGIGLAREYLNQPDLTAEKFIPNPFSDNLRERLYKTGDLARYLPDGSIEFLGRIDQQVKIRGFRIELGEIEAVLCQHLDVREAVVTIREEQPGNKRLFAYVVLSQNSSSLSELRHFLKLNLPDYMVPAAFIRLDTLPLTHNGKVDRRALPVLKNTRPELETAFVAPCTPVEEQVAEIWAGVIGVEKVGINDNFFELGGDSLVAAQLIIRLQEAFEVELPVRYLFESPTVAGVAQTIETLRGQSSATLLASTTTNLTAEAVLDAEIYPRGTLTNDVSQPRHIFLTGATGFLGAFLLHELLQQTQAEIHCLVRAPNKREGLKRLQKALEKYSLWNPCLSSRIIPIPGDLAQPLLGLSDQQFQSLADQIDIIYHNGAKVNYLEPYSLHKATNVLGTQEVLRLACWGKLKPVHYLSTIAIWGTIGYFTERQLIQEEDDITQSESYLSMDMGYAQSKWVAEQLVWIAKSRGIPVSIFRPGSIMGHSETGSSNTDDFVARMIKGCIQIGCFPDLIKQGKEFIPVDYTSKAIVHLARQEKSLGKAFHLVPLPSQSIDVVDFFELICSSGYPLKKLPYTRWKEELIHQTRHSQDNALFPLLPMLTEKAPQESLTLWELYQKMPAYDCQNTLNGLVGTSLVCPPMDANLLDTYFSYFIRSGFLEPPQSESKYDDCQLSVKKQTPKPLFLSVSQLRRAAAS